MLKAVLSGDVGEDILENVMRPCLLKRARDMTACCPQQVLDDLQKKYDTFKNQCPDGRTDSVAFSKVVLSDPQWSMPEHQKLLNKIFRTLDADGNNILDFQEWLAAVVHLSTYLFCSAPGCGKMLDVLKEDGEICHVCSGFALCSHCAEQASSGEAHPKCPAGHVCGSVSEIEGLTSSITCASCQESHDMVLGYVMGDWGEMHMRPVPGQPDQWLCELCAVRSTPDCCNMTWDTAHATPGLFLSAAHHDKCVPDCPKYAWTTQLYLQHQMESRKGLHCKTCAHKMFGHPATEAPALAPTPAAAAAPKPPPTPAPPAPEAPSAVSSPSKPPALMRQRSMAAPRPPEEGGPAAAAAEGAAGANFTSSGSSVNSSFNTVNSSIDGVNSSFQSASNSSSSTARLPTTDGAAYSRDQEVGGADVKLDFLGCPVKLPGESTTAWIKRCTRYRKQQMKELLHISRAHEHGGRVGSQGHQGEMGAADSVVYQDRSCAGSISQAPMTATDVPRPQTPPASQQQKPQHGMGTGGVNKQQEQQRQGMKPAGVTQMCVACQKPHFVMAQHPTGRVEEVPSYLKGGSVPHMKKLPGGVWICEWCSYYHCSRCNELQLEVGNRDPGLWGKPKTCNPKCEKKKGVGRDALRIKVLERARAMEQVHCLGCREPMVVVGRVPFEAPPSQSMKAVTALQLMGQVVGITVTAVVGAVAH